MGEAMAYSAGWPEALLPVFRRSLPCEFASLTRAGAPITPPVRPYLGAGGQTIDVGMPRVRL